MREPEKEVEDSPPPLFGTWPRVYVAILIYLAAMIAVLFGITRYFRPPT